MSMIYSRTACMVNISVVNFDGEVCNFTCHEEVFIDCDVTCCILSHNSNFFVQWIKHILLWIHHHRSHRRDQNSFSGSDLALSIFIVQQIDVNRDDLELDEVFKFGTVVSKPLPCLHALRKICWHFKCEGVAWLPERKDIVLERMNNLG